MNRNCSYCQKRFYYPNLDHLKRMCSEIIHPIWKIIKEWNNRYQYNIPIINYDVCINGNIVEYDFFMKLDFTTHEDMFKVITS